MDKNLIKKIATEIACNCVSAKEIDSELSELKESGFEKESAIGIIKLAKEIRKNRIESIKVYASGLHYDSARTLQIIWKDSYNSKDWKELTKKNTTFAKVDTLESFLLAYYSKVTEGGKLVIDSKDRTTKEITHKERDIHKVNAQTIWNNCVENVLRESSDKKKVQTIYKDSEILTLEKQAELKAQKKAEK